METNTASARDLTADVVTAYLTNNQVRATDLPDLISSIYRALTDLTKPVEAVVEKPEPHMPIKKTIQHEYLVSLEDRKHYKSLKRHLAGRGLTPAQYREKWGLGPDYPMTAPGYSAKRSELAKAAGLGQSRIKAQPETASVDTQAPAPRARKKADPKAVPAAKALGRARKKVAEAA